MSNIQYAPIQGNLRIHGKTPIVEHARQSYSYLLRGILLALVQARPFFSGFTFTTNRSLQIQPEQLPLCGVYFLQEIGTPSTEPQTGPVKLAMSVRMGFSVFVQNNDGDDAEYQLDKAYQAITHLFTDPASYNNPLCRVQGFVGLSRRNVFGNINQTNETPYAELQLEVMCDIGTINYDPTITDDFETLHVTTQYPYGNTGAPPIIRNYDVQQQ